MTRGLQTCLFGVVCVFLEILSVVHYGTLDTCDGLLKLLTQLLLWFEAGIVAGIQIRNW